MNSLTFFYCFLFYPLSYRYQAPSRSVKILEMSEFCQKGFWLQMFMNCLYSFMHAFTHGAFINNHQSQIISLILLQLLHISIIFLLRFYFKRRIMFVASLKYRIAFILFNIFIYCYSFIQNDSVPYNIIFAFIILIILLITIFKILFNVGLILLQIYQKIKNCTRRFEIELQFKQKHQFKKQKLTVIYNLENNKRKTRSVKNMHLLQIPKKPSLKIHEQNQQVNNQKINNEFRNILQCVQTNTFENKQEQKMEQRIIYSSAKGRSYKMVNIAELKKKQNKLSYNLNGQPQNIIQTLDIETKNIKQNCYAQQDSNQTDLQSLQLQKMTNKKTAQFVKSQIFQQQIHENNLNNQNSEKGLYQFNIQYNNKDNLKNIQQIQLSQHQQQVRLNIQISQEIINEERKQQVNLSKDKHKQRSEVKYKEQQIKNFINGISNFSQKHDSHNAKIKQAQNITPIQLNNQFNLEQQFEQLQKIQALKFKNFQQQQNVQQLNVLQLNQLNQDKIKNIIVQQTDDIIYDL